MRLSLAYPLSLLVACAAFACGDDKTDNRSDLPAGPDATVDGSQPARDAGNSAEPDAANQDDDAGGDGEADAGAEAPLEVEVLREAVNDAGAPYQLLRLKHEGKAATYAQWYPPPADAGTDRPVVVYTKPYDGIDWSGEEVDERWADGGSGAQEDVDSPDAGENPGIIMYTRLAPESVEDNNIYRLHDMGTLLLYGRFYAGGDVQNDIDDMTTGLDFLREAEHVDRSRIGIYGGSWGGFLAVYGAAYAHPDVKPAVGVALAPVSDFEAEVDFVTRDLPMRYALQPSRDACATFFAPYLRRIGATREARGGYDGLTAEDIVARIDMPFLLMHDDWDTLVSFEQSQKLVELAPEHFEPLWLLHQDPPFLWDQTVNQHGPLLATYGTANVTFSITYLLTHLADADQPINTVWEDDKMRLLSSDIRNLQRAGKDVAFYANRLRELADPRVQIYSFNTAMITPGAKAVADVVNAVWGTTFTEANVRDELDKGLPPAM